MSPSEFRTSIDFIAQAVFPKMRIGQSHFLTVEYLGGEVLLVPPHELAENVRYARETLATKVGHLRDGAQSNLIGTKRRILDLHDLFDGNLGTSWDPYTNERTIKGSSKLYETLLSNSLKELETQRDHTPGRVFVLDRKTLPHIEQEVSRSIEEGYDLVIRPVFLGGSDDIDPAPARDIQAAMIAAFDIWKGHRAHRVEPFFSLFQRRAARGKKNAPNMAGCPFQSDCAFRSLSLDPDGSLYICQEMADSKNYPLGNALTGDFHTDTWRLLSRRTAHLSDECSKCRWKDECGGGCMNEAIQRFGDPFARTELCPVWKSIFSSIEHTLQEQAQ